MRSPLRRNSWLNDVDRLMRRYKYCRMYCRSVCQDFYGIKKAGIHYLIDAEHDPEVEKEFSHIMNPGYGLSNSVVYRGSVVEIRRLSSRDLSVLGEPIYECGRFFSKEANKDVVLS